MKNICNMERLVNDAVPLRCVGMDGKEQDCLGVITGGKLLIHPQRLVELQVAIEADAPAVVDTDLYIRWLKLSDAERLTLMSRCCTHCGKLNTRCACWNDD